MNKVRFLTNALVEVQTDNETEEVLWKSGSYHKAEKIVKEFEDGEFWYDIYLENGGVVKGVKATLIENHGTPVRNAPKPALEEGDGKLGDEKYAPDLDDVYGSLGIAPETSEKTVDKSRDSD